VRADDDPSTRRNVPLSAIWQFGVRYVSLTNPKEVAWRCSQCHIDHVIGGDLTSNARRHLRTMHGILADSANKKRVRDGDEEVEEEGEERRGFQVVPQIRGLVQTVNFDTYRYHLIRWIVERHLPFTIVEDANFQAMLASLNANFQQQSIRSGDTVRDWIEDEFLEAKKLVREEVLTKAISKIHISCDLWTSPNGFTLYSVAAHFVTRQKHNQTVLLALKRMRAAHSGEQIAEAIVTTLREYEIVDKLGVFIGDNVDTNDVAWREVLKQTHPQRNPVASRSRCLSHIINLAAKAFLLGDNTEAFEATVDAVSDSTPQDSEVMKKAQDAWRKKGPISKMHNIITWIRCTSQRREAFIRTVVGEEGDGKCLQLSKNSIYETSAS
jgi:hypothetical protein